MSLSAATLASGIVAMAGPSFPPSYADAGAGWANAYATYAADALTLLGGSPIALPGSALADAFTSAFSSGFDPATTASLMAAGIVAFWLPVVFSDAGIVVAIGDPSILAGGLLSTWAANVSGQLSAAQAADAIAAVMDSFSPTVIVETPTVPTPTIGPIS